MGRIVPGYAYASPGLQTVLISLGLAPPACMLGLVGTRSAKLSSRNLRSESASGPCPANQAKSDHGGSDADAHVCEPPQLADPSRRIDRRAIRGAAYGQCARGVADAAGALCQRLSRGRSNQFTLAHPLPEDERVVRTVVRGREPGGSRRRARRRCGREVAAGRIHGWTWRHCQQRACDRKLCQASLRPGPRFHVHLRHVAAAEYPGRQEGSVLLGSEGAAGCLQEGAAQIHLRIGRNSAPHCISRAR